MIGATSRYAISTVAVVDVAGKSRQVIVPSMAESFTITYTTHIWTGADRIDLLASSFYGDATQWWQIADGNPEIVNWDTVAPGTVIRIPYG